MSRYTDALDAGRCGACKHREATMGYSTCLPCRLRINARMRVSARDRLQSRREAGLCQRCAAPSDGAYYCPPCRDWRREYDRDRRAMRRVL